MIVAQLHQQPVPLDRDTHRGFALAVPWSDWSIAAKLNSVFVAISEFRDACHDFPIVFIRTGQEDGGEGEFAPIAVMGLAHEENLFVEQGRWRSRYEPIVLRCYPFGIARLDADRYAVCIDAAWPGVRPDGHGERLFTDAGEPTTFTAGIQQQLEQFEVDIERTRRALKILADHDLLREMRFDGTLPDGQKVSVDGFYAIDEAKVRDLPDETVLALHREGLFPLIYAHWSSFGHMRQLLQWRADRLAAASTV
jgi:hypothetical protein